MREPTQVVVGFDFSHSGQAALERAVGVVARAPWHILQVVTVIDPHFAFPAVPLGRGEHVDVAYADRVQSAVSADVAAELAAAEVDANVHFFVHARIGRKPAVEILDVAKDVGAHLIIVGSRGVTGIERFMLGSVSERIVREAHCTVEVARDRTYRDVPLLEVVEIEHGHNDHAAPHRYSYQDRRASRRPNDWPLY